ncbi:PREDICTED: leucine-rich repeat and calponin homology domain-containing protein 4 [Nanorana parkeri]|uniref:leucine-rich repeat and calponin homology domain-containing protein 4 n=1 Tax=Nanorana parkeri TaxID=125878 RepID=UPI00085447A2|nr:PREDICTED: leucine-rich repeat and calponin homology domain-containing protein 4 [Nanorana parkeri]
MVPLSSVTNSGGVVGSCPVSDWFMRQGGFEVALQLAVAWQRVQSRLIPLSMAAGSDEEEGGGDSELQRPGGGRRNAERSLEEAARTGELSLSGRRLRSIPERGRSYDLTDLTRADLSKNRFSEVPGELCQLVSLESLNLYHNCLRSLPECICNLQALTYLNISRNLLTSLPPYLCRLPLTVLIASNNKLNSIPEEVGAMTNLRQLDISCNEIQSLPPQMGSLESLRELNVRRNQLTSLPEELSELPLTRLDISCNRISHIPVCYRHLRHLQTIILDNNPLQYPPAQICLKGKVHIFKYLNIEACSKPAPELADLGKLSRPTSFTTCLADDVYSSRPYGCLDSGFNSVDSGSKRWSGNESADEMSDLSFRVAGLGRDARQLREKVNGIDADSEHTDFIDSSTNEEEEDAKSDTGLHMTEKRKPELHSTPRAEDRTLVGGPVASPPSPGASRQDRVTEERRRPETLLLWRERERQQLQQKQETLRRPSVDQRDSLHKNLPASSPPAQSQSEAVNGPSENCSRLRSQGSQASIGTPISPPSQPSDSSVTQKPRSFLFRSSSRGAARSYSGSDPGSGEGSSPIRMRTSRASFDEKTVQAQLRKDIESHLNITLQDPLCESLANGVVLCQLVNHLRPRFIPFIHVTSPAVPKLNPVKCRTNVDSFLEACQRLGVPERDLCSASDILGGRSLDVIQRMVSSLLLLLLSSRDTPTSSPSSALSDETAMCSTLLQLLSQHHGFLLFYALLMLALCVAYNKLSVL